MNAYWIAAAVRTYYEDGSEGPGEWLVHPEVVLADDQRSARLKLHRRRELKDVDAEEVVEWVHPFE